MCKRFARGRFGTAMVLAGGLALSMFSLDVMAQSGCDDLMGEPVTQDVHYDNQIQPIFNDHCIVCHSGPNPPPFIPGGGLNLEAGQSHGNLINEPSSQDGSWIRVVPSDLDVSLLFHKINCNTPPVGVRMPQGGPALSAAQQALFRDWINQGALPSPPPPPTFSIGGTVGGLASGATVVLQNNGADNLSVSTNGPFTFDTELEDGEDYIVTVFQQPANPSQTCTVANGSGAVTGAGVTDVEVTCVTNTFTIGGTVSGLDGDGLVLQNNGGDDLAISEDGPFTFATELPQGAGYEVTVFQQAEDPVQFCVVENGIGVMPAADVDNVEVECFDQDLDVFEDRFEV